MQIQIVGGGSWGLAQARLLALKNHDVRLWCREQDRPEELRATRHSPFFLTDMYLPDQVEVSPEVNPDADIAVFAVPSHAMRAAAEQWRFSRKTIRVSVAKGIENETLLRMSEVIEEVCGPCTVLSLSGPSHAEEVAKDMPTSVVVAGDDLQACETVQSAFTGRTFRVYTSPDIVGVEIGGSLKNVTAIAAGVSDGFGFGDNAKAALITRGLSEMSRLGVAMGAAPLTFAGLSGMGDLIATCSSRHSRNRAVGERLAQGAKLEEILASSPMVAEGVRTASSTHALARAYNVELPIAEQVYNVLFQGASPRGAVAELMQREAKPERT